MRSMVFSSLHPSRTMASSIPHIRSILDSFAPNHLPILPQKQMEGSLKMTEKMNAKRGRPARKKNKPAAVLVPLCTVNNVPSILFTLRSAKLSSHAGQISFPGGHADCAEQGNPIETALRETREELLGHFASVGAENVNDKDDKEDDNISYNFDEGIDILGQTGAVPSITGNMVTPIIGALTYDLPSHDAIHIMFPGNEGEVDEVFAMSVEELLRVETSEELKRLGTMGPVFPAGGEQRGKIWGLSAIILRPILHQILVPAGFVSTTTVRRRCEL